MKSGGEYDDLSKMQRVDGERVAAGVFTGSRGAPLYQLRIGPRSVDCSESRDYVACQTAGSEGGVIVSSSA